MINLRLIMCPPYNLFQSRKSTNKMKMITVSVSVVCVFIFFAWVLSFGSE